MRMGKVASGSQRNITDGLPPEASYLAFMEVPVCPHVAPANVGCDANGHTLSPTSKPPQRCRPPSHRAGFNRGSRSMLGRCPTRPTSLGMKWPSRVKRATAPHTCVADQGFDRS